MGGNTRDWLRSDFLLLWKRLSVRTSESGRGKSESGESPYLEHPHGNDLSHVGENLILGVALEVVPRLSVLTLEKLEFPEYFWMVEESRVKI